MLRWLLLILCRYDLHWGAIEVDDFEDDDGIHVSCSRCNAYWYVERQRTRT